jgi:hypothetical protein
MRIPAGVGIRRELAAVLKIYEARSRELAAMGLTQAESDERIRTEFDAARDPCKPVPPVNLQLPSDWTGVPRAVLEAIAVVEWQRRQPGALMGSEDIPEPVTLPRADGTTSKEPAALRPEELAKLFGRRE